MQRSSAISRGSVTLTHGVRVAVSPSYLPQQSQPEKSRYVFGYRIRISNESERSLRLLSRRWLIVDADGEQREVVGEGVVGEQPDLEPGAAFTYSSFCPLETPWGTMEGSYTLQDSNGQTLAVRIGRFFLVADDHVEPGE